MSRAVLAVAGIAVIFAIGVLLSCVYTVHQTEQALVVQFGAPQAVVSDPGLHTKLPWQSVQIFEKRLLNLDVPSEEVIAQDKKRRSWMLSRAGELSIPCASIRRSTTRTRQSRGSPRS